MRSLTAGFARLAQRSGAPPREVHLDIVSTGSGPGIFERFHYLGAKPSVMSPTIAANIIHLNDNFLAR